MKSFLIFLIIVSFIYAIGDYTRKNSFNKLDVYRQVEESHIVEGEKFKVTIVIENKKKMPIFFMLVKEEFPYEIFQKQYYNITQYILNKYERVKKTYTIPIKNRGVYVLRRMNIVTGDIFGFFTSNKEIEDYVELLVYPKIISIKRLKFDSTSHQGDTVIKRWIYKDPLYIKGIREYNVEDRMKDIHWKSSLKMNKLMVKEYDYTSEREFIAIINVQCDNIYWRYINKKLVERAITVTVSVAQSAINEGIKIGAWTNANIINYFNESKDSINSSNSLNDVLELCARLDYMPRYSFSDFLNKKIKYFKPNNTYIIISSFFTEEDKNILIFLRNKGINLKIVDVSDKGDISQIRGVEKINYKGEVI